MQITTHVNVAKAGPGRHNAGPGLYLIVSTDGQSRRWAFRYTKPATRKVTELGLGSADLVTLAEARDLAIDHRRAVAKGQDPVEAKREARKHLITFGELASAFIAVNRPRWKSLDHRRMMGCC
jgi:hypothetical protein